MLGRSRSRAALAAALLFLVPTTPVNAQRFDGKPIDALAQDALKAWDAPGVSIAIVTPDKVLYLKGFGTTELGGKTPVSENTVFAISSCTKAFTVAGLAMLVDEGKIAWDDPVRKHVPSFHLADPLADKQVTIRDLLCHRTGVASHDLLWYRAPWSLDEQIRRIGLVKPNRSFRSAFQYQSVMFVAGGRALEHASGLPWTEFVQKRIFDPLGMGSATFTTPEALKSADHAMPHKKNAKGEVEATPWYNFDSPNPACSINASARDMSKWLQLQLGDGAFKGKRLLSMESFTETRMPQTIIRLEGASRALNPFTTQMSYGLGWVLHDYRGHPLAAHGGRIDGMRAHIVLAPADGFGLVILTNLDDTRMNNALGNSIIDHILGLPFRDWNAYYGEATKADEAGKKERWRQREEARKPNTKPTHDLQAYVGEYEDPAYGTAKVALEKGKLLWQWSSFRTSLDHYHFDTFLVPNEVLAEPLLTFHLGADGEVASLHVLDVDFKKVKKGK